ncbi:MAG: DUF1501 domain-containing protein [Pseudomonadota bacterium]|nr:DUF1501 domain-containing protein [Pseudomonadota bacterium]
MHSHRYTRRSVLRSLAGASAAGMLTGLGGTASSAASAYNGKLLVNLQLVGALDVTSFADPKTNVPGKPLINNWAQSAEIHQAGNIRYAPFAQNAAFFDKYYRDMLVINGIDAQTNSHTTGVLHNWSGRNSEGYPTLTALFAAVNQRDMPMPYLNFGGLAATAGIVDVTQIGRMAVLHDLVKPNLAESSGNRYIEDSDWERIAAMHRAGLAARSAAPTTLEASAMQQRAYADALARSQAIEAFADVLPPVSEVQRARYVGNNTSTLHQQMQVALLAFKGGLALAADVFESGFDTHDDHDARHALALANVTDAIDFFWSYAASLGLAERVVLVIGSDFGRTPHYNAGGGKDHWPIGSVLVMCRNAPFTNRVVGLTDAEHNALKIDPVTLVEDAVDGVTLHPAHVHKALRRLVGIDTAAVTRMFPFVTTEDVAFFG